MWARTIHGCTTLSPSARLGLSHTDQNEHPDLVDPLGATALRETRRMTSAVDELVQLLDLEIIEVNIFL